jgi:N-methylhydantoinase A
VFNRAALGAGATIHGPAIIEEYGSTTVIVPRWDASVDAWGNVFVARRAETRG